MVKIKMKPINVSNTTLSYKARRHRKFDAKQAKRHNFGKAHCMICDEVFTKYSHNVLVCSEECQREKRNAYDRKYHEKNHEKILAKQRKYRGDNREKVNAAQRKLYAENSEKIKAQRRARYHAKKKQEEE